MRAAGLHHAPLPARPRRLGGFTLVELMVSITISLVLVLAATAMYLATRESQRNIDQASAANEAGGYTLRTIGRELMNAAFYPAVRTESVAQANVLTSYTNPTTVAAYNVGVFGCEGAKFDPGTGACGATVAGAPDSLVVSYFTNDAFGTSVGQRADCTGNDVGYGHHQRGPGGRGGLPATVAAPVRGQPLCTRRHHDDVWKGARCPPAAWPATAMAQGRATTSNCCPASTISSSAMPCSTTPPEPRAATTRPARSTRWPTPPSTERS